MSNYLRHNNCSCSVSAPKRCAADKTVRWPPKTWCSAQNGPVETWVLYTRSTIFNNLRLLENLSTSSILPMMSLSQSISPNTGSEAWFQTILGNPSSTHTHCNSPVHWCGCYKSRSHPFHDIQTTKCLIFFMQLYHLLPKVPNKPEHKLISAEC